jgi:TIR domain
MSPSERPVAPISLFYSYSHKDEALRNRLEAHLAQLQADGVISGWHDRRIAAGTEWEGAISEQLDNAGIILLLVSADFLASRYCRDVEIKRAMKRHKARTARVIPVILRPVDAWHASPFGKLQALPKDGRPVSSWRNRDEAFAEIARGIREAATDLVARTQNASAPATRSEPKTSARPQAGNVGSGPGPKDQTDTARSQTEAASAIARKIRAFDLVSGILSGQRKAMLAQIELRVKNKVEHGITDEKLFTIRTKGEVKRVKTLSAFLSFVKRDPRAELECTEELLKTTKDGIAEYLQDRDGDFRSELVRRLERDLLEVFLSQEFTRIPDGVMTERIRQSVKEKIVPKLAEAALTAIGTIHFHLGTLNKALTATAATLGTGAAISAAVGALTTIPVPEPTWLATIGVIAAGTRAAVHGYERYVARQKFAELLSKSISTDIDNNHFDNIKNAIATNLSKVIEDIIPELLRST